MILLIHKNNTTNPLLSTLDHPQNPAFKYGILHKLTYYPLLREYI